MHKQQMRAHSSNIRPSNSEFAPCPSGVAKPEAYCPRVQLSAGLLGHPKPPSVFGQRGPLGVSSLSKVPRLDKYYLQSGARGLQQTVYTVAIGRPV